MNPGDRPVVLQARTTACIAGTHEGWSVAGAGDAGKDCLVDLEIRGDDRQGYTFEMGPHGFFATDAWYEDLDTALEVAQEQFGIEPDGWTRTEDDR